MLESLIADPRVWSAAAVVSVLLLMLVLFIKQRRRTADMRMVQRQIKKLAVRCMEQVAISDPVEGELRIDYLLHTDRLIVVLNVQNFPGKIYGGDRVERWTQVCGHRSYKFANPQGYLDSCVASVKGLLPGVPVVGRIVFSTAGEFPKGIPTNVVMGNALVDQVRALEGGLAPIERTGVNMAWDKLQAALQERADPRVHLSKRQAIL